MASALVYAILFTAWGILSGPVLTLARDIPEPANPVLALASDMIPEQATEIGTVKDTSDGVESITSDPNMLQTVVQNIQLGGIDASVYHFDKFPPSPPGIDLFGSATVNDISLRLVPYMPSQVGSILTKVPIKFYNQERKIAGVFGTSFQYRFVPPFTAGRPRDGFTFYLTASNTARGSLGGALGYAGSGNKQSAAIEFDTYRNLEYNDPNDNHIGFDTQDSVTSVVTTNSTLFDLLNDGKPVFVWIQFWPQGGPLKFLIQVFISTTPTRPQTAVLEAPADLGAILGVVRFDNLFVGFTASTGPGSIAQIVDISDWAFFSASLQ